MKQWNLGFKQAHTSTTAFPKKLPMTATFGTQRWFRWFCVSLLTILVGSWLLSIWYNFGWNGDYECWVEDGSLVIGKFKTNSPIRRMAPRWEFTRRQFPLQWIPSLRHGLVLLPLWVLVVITAPVYAISICRSRLAKRLSACSSCGYSLVGLNPEGERVVCPECGHTQPTTKLSP